MTTQSTTTLLLEDNFGEESLNASKREPVPACVMNNSGRYACKKAGMLFDKANPQMVTFDLMVVVCRNVCNIVFVSNSSNTDSCEVLLVGLIFFEDKSAIKSDCLAR